MNILPLLHYASSVTPSPTLCPSVPFRRRSMVILAVSQLTTDRCNSTRFASPFYDFLPFPFVGTPPFFFISLVLMNRILVIIEMGLIYHTQIAGTGNPRCHQVETPVTCRITRGTAADHLTLAQLSPEAQTRWKYYPQFLSPVRYDSILIATRPYR